MWSWSYVQEILPTLLRGLLVTVEATVLGYALALVLGLAIAVLRHSAGRVTGQVLRWAVEFVRSTPLLVQLFFLFYVLPGFGITLGALATGVIGLGVHYATYTSEVYRSGIESVPRGQWEAATALSLPSRRVWTGVVLPQAVPKVIPALGNYVIAMFKDTPLLLGITVLEMLGSAYKAGSESYRMLEPVTLVGLLFVAVSVLAGLLVRRLERRYGN
ncbi:ectoine/hydroxyectoine ABC transporter permease subunit EhuD [Actinomadura sp. HBU206391]|nr:ectoine/hydroxyectoine ABC transporter permease subunit EhuD [Actinomadura sp. HBU206391]MBC6460495.1 ectoine/hydroxyectoine ABC transporter permease subunit EhuD [Actinomadura sp. HBU206391]